MIITGNTKNGRTERGGFQVHIVNQGFGAMELTPLHSQSVINHSPDGFAWGYGGSGPAQLALAILLLFCDKNFAVRHYQSFKSEFVAKWGNEFIISDIDVKTWLKTRGWEERMEKEELNEKKGSGNNSRESSGTKTGYRSDDQGKKI